MRRLESFPDYSVTDDGRVFSHKRGRTRELKLRTAGFGYPGVSLCRNGDITSRNVHVLVAEAFLGPRPANARVVRHLDGNPANNHVTNLAYGTFADNEADKLLHGRRPVGSAVAGSKLSAEDVEAIRRAYADGETQASITSRYGLHPTTVHSTIHGDTWKHLPVPDYRTRIPARPMSSWNRGELSGNAKLTDAQTREIHARAAAGESSGALASEFGVSYTSVRRIARGEAWATRRPSGMVP